MHLHPSSHQTCLRPSAGLRASLRSARNPRKQQNEAFTVCFVFHPSTDGLCGSFSVLEIHHLYSCLKESLVAMEILFFHHESFLKVEGIGKMKCKFFSFGGDGEKCLEWQEGLT